MSETYELIRNNVTHFTKFMSMSLYWLFIFLAFGHFRNLPIHQQPKESSTTSRSQLIPLVILFAITGFDWALRNGLGELSEGTISSVLLLSSFAFAFKFRHVGPRVLLGWGAPWISMTTLIPIAAIFFDSDWRNIGTRFLEFAFILIFVAFKEEFLFRGLIMPRLELLLGRNIGLVLSSLIFGVAHLSSSPDLASLQLATVAIIYGLFFGYLVQVSSSLWPAIIFHAVWNYR